MTNRERTTKSEKRGAVTGTAERVVVSFRSPETDPNERDDWWIADSEWLQTNMSEEIYRKYLRRAHAGPVEIGDEWDEFVNCGCASPEDVILRVERVEGGSVIGPGTTIEVVSRKDIITGEEHA